MLATISFNLKFTCVLARWEGSIHDSRVLNDAFARLGGFSIPEGIIGSLHLLGLLILINFFFFILLKNSSDFGLFFNICR